MFKSYSMELAGRKFTVETGKMAELSNASVFVKYGDTAVLVNVTASKDPREGIDFFPLSVDYEEKLYSVGKIPGSFQRKEGRPSEKAVLASRVIDRPIRPLFPDDFRNDVCINAMVLSVEQDNQPEICAMIGATIALAISDIPFNGPLAGVSVAYVENNIIINPTVEEREKSTLNLTVAGTMEKIAMIEAGANEISEEIMLEAIKKGHSEIKKVCQFINEIVAEIGKPKFEYKSFKINDEIYSKIEEKYKGRMYLDIQTADKEVRDANMYKLEEDVKLDFSQIYGEDEANKLKKDIKDSLYKLEKKAVRKMIFEEHKRPDGRGINDIRKLSCEVGVLARTHGSALFTRGQTQVLSIATLGMKSEEQMLDGLDKEETKRYMHHYNFPPFSVGEARQSRGPGRREIGHGALAEKALEPVIPSEKDFPYTIRVVSEVLSSNGSTSQASICASTLALMDAGVPIKKPVAGISTGLVTDENDSNKYVMITDIQGLEDFFGDMDFKVAGTHDGITAIQVDIKIDGLTMEVIEEALERTKKARKYILDDIMLKVIPESRKEVSKYAPRIITINIKPDKIRDVIGPGGKIINKIISETGVKIDIQEDGTVFIYSTDTESAQNALDMIEDITREIEVNGMYLGTVIKIMPFGAFMDIGAGKEGLLHISKISKERVEKVEDVLKTGEKFLVKVTEIDSQGRINLTKIFSEEE